MKTLLRVLAIAAGIMLVANNAAAGEASELRVAKQYGLGYLQMMLMEDQKLVEKHAKAAGLGDLKITWATFRSSDVMNDALLSGSLEFASIGTPGLATIWAKTRGTPVEVKAAVCYNYFPTGLNTRDPNIKSLADYTEKHKIAVPAVKVSNQAIQLQMAAAKHFGPANYGKLDALTVSMSHPDGMAALLSGAGEVSSHFTAPPFVQKEREKPGIRKVTSSVEILGGPNCFNFIAATTKFYRDNPKTYGAFLAALQEATNLIAKDKRAAAEQYLRLAKDKTPVEEMLKIMNDPGNEYVFNVTPAGDMQMMEFMHSIGTIKVKPASYADLLFVAPGK
jgi:NitT/TauT family transport system substrate-binding protein